MANFVKGEKRSPNAGRKKGTPNKVTSSFRQALAASGFDLAAAAVKLFKSTQDENIKVKMLELIAKYTQVVPTSEFVVAETSAPEENLSDAELEELARSAEPRNG